MARRRAEVFGVGDRIEFHAANGEELSRVLPPAEYDLIYSFGVIHHTPHPARVVAELRRFARPGATLKVMVYHRRSWKVLGIVLAHGRGRFWKLPELVAAYSEAQTGCPVTHVYDRAEGRQLLEREGFRVREVRVEHVFPYRIPDYVEYRFVEEWYFRWMPESVFRAFERRFGWHLLLTAEAL